jgi:hypothetical protein
LREPKRAGRTLSLIRKALTPEVKPPGLDPETLTGGHESLIRSLPAWVKRFGFLAGAGEYCLWCEPRPAPVDAFPSQMVLDMPRGRYWIDIFDTSTRTWLSRESAEGGPLVAGLPYTGNPLLAWIRPFVPD